MAKQFNAYHVWLGIPPEEQPANHYRLLGVRLFETDADVIEHAADRQMAHVRMFQSGKQAEHAERLLNELATARVCLLSVEKRAVYETDLRQQLGDAAPAGANAATAGDPAVFVPVAKTRRPSAAVRQRASRSGPIIACIVGGVLCVGLIATLVAALNNAGNRQTADAKPNGSTRSTAESNSAKKVEKPTASRAESPGERRGPEKGPPGETTRPPVAPAPLKPPPAEPKPAAPEPPLAAPPAAPPPQCANSIGMTLAEIPPGEFMMGTTERDVETHIQQNLDIVGYAARVRAEAPRHRVKISKGFLLGVYEVTQAEYATVMGVNPGALPSNGGRKDWPDGEDTGRCPVDNVSWFDAREFCNRLSQRDEERQARRVYRLPTEAEWEYACTAGGALAWPVVTTQADVCQAAWVKDNSGSRPHRAGGKPANPWGLCDMLGNVREWCADSYDPNYYVISAAVDPVVPSAGPDRVTRGGGWNTLYGACRPTLRGRDKCGQRNVIGFRVAADVWTSQECPPQYCVDEPLVAVALGAPQIWRYTTQKPKEKWADLDFNDTAWSEGPAPFGAGKPGLGCPPVRTDWDSHDLWVRCAFPADVAATESVAVWLCCDDVAGVYLNGLKIAGAENTGAYEIIDLDDLARQQLRPGRNVLAIHAYNKGGAQYLDAGLFRRVPRLKPLAPPPAATPAAVAPPAEPKSE